MNCKNCGQEISEDMEYCDSCVEKLEPTITKQINDVDTTEQIDNVEPLHTTPIDKTEPLPIVPMDKTTEEKPKNKKKKHVGLIIFLIIIAIPVLLILLGVFYFVMGNIGPFDAPEITEEIEFGSLDMEQYIQLDDNYDLTLTLEHDTLNSVLDGVIKGDMIPDNLPIDINNVYVGDVDVRIFINIGRKKNNFPISFEPEIYDDGEAINLSINSIKYSKFNLPLPTFLLRLLPDDLLSFNKREVGLPVRFVISDFVGGENYVQLEIDMDYKGIIEDMREGYIDEELLQELSKKPEFAAYARLLTDENVTEEEIGEFISQAVFSDSELNYLLSPLSGDTSEELLGSMFFESSNIQEDISSAKDDISK